MENQQKKKKKKKIQVYIKNTYKKQTNQPPPIPKQKENQLRESI